MVKINKFVLLIGVSLLAVEAALASKPFDLSTSDPTRGDVRQT